MIGFGVHFANGLDTEHMEKRKLKQKVLRIKILVTQ